MRKKSIPSLISKGEWFILFVCSVKKREGHIGVAIPRTLIPHSSSRNRLRRQIREAIRILKKEEGASLQDKMMRREFLIRVKQGGKPSFETIQKEMRTHFKRLGSLR